MPLGISVLSAAWDGFVIVDIQKMHYAYVVRLWSRKVCIILSVSINKFKKSGILTSAGVAIQKYLKGRLCQSSYLPSQYGITEIAGYCLCLCWAKMIWSHWSIVSVTHHLFPMALAVCFTPSVPGCSKFLQSLSVRHTHANSTCLFIWSSRNGFP